MNKSPYLTDFDKEYNKKYEKYGLNFDLASGNGVSKVEDLKNKQLYTLNWQPQAGKQELAWDYMTGEDVNVIGYGGAKGGGKTELGINGNLHWSYEYEERFNGLYVRNTYKALEEIIERIRRGLDRDYLGHGKSHNFNSQKSVLTLRNGARLVFFYVEGKGLDVLHGSEFTHITLEEPQQMINMAKVIAPKISGLSRTSQQVVKKQFWLFNPGGPSTSWLKENFVNYGHNNVVDVIRGENKMKLKAKQVFIKAKVSDNPLLLKNDPDYVAQLEAMPEHLRRAWLDGDFDVQAGVAFPTLTKTSNGFSDQGFRPSDYPWYISMDWGFVSPSCVGFYCLYKDALIIRFDELKFTQKTVDEAAYLIKEKMNLYRNDTFQYAVADTSIFAETEGKSIAIRMGENQGLWFRKAYKERNTGFLKVYRFLKDQKLLINVNCDYFWNTVPHLLLSETKESDIEQNPKQDDHAYDEMRYMIMSLLLE